MPEYEKRVAVTVMLTPTEIKRLRSECQDYVDVFGVFLREKLLATKTVRLMRAVDPKVRSEMANLLKFSGALTMIAKRLEYNALISQEFIDMSANLKRLVLQARYNINEVLVSEAIVPKAARSLSKLTYIISSFQGMVTLKDVSALHENLSEIVAELEAFCTTHGLDID